MIRTNPKDYICQFQPNKYYSKAIAIFFSINLLSCTTRSNSIEQKNFSFDTQYNQFYISSVGKDFNADEKKDMNSFTEDMNRRLGVEKNALIVFTESYGKIRGDIEILDAPSTNNDYSKYDHVVEGSLNIESGELQILDSPHSHVELSMKVNPGKYKVRIYSSNLNSVKETDLPHPTDKDYYHIELWKSDNLENKVIKQFQK